MRVILYMSICSSLICSQHAQSGTRPTQRHANVANTSGKRWRTYVLHGITSCSYVFFYDSTYAFIRGYDAPPSADTVWGKYRLDAGWLIALRRGSGSPSEVRADTFFLSQWGNLRLLVGKDELTELCNDYNSDRYSAKHRKDWIDLGSPFFQDSATIGRLPYGKPRLPLPWRKFLLRRPITARVTKIDTTSNELLVNRGSKDGVFLGCMFYAPWVINGYRSLIPLRLQVTQVMPHESKAQPESYLIRIKLLQDSLKDRFGDSARAHSSIREYLADLKRVYRHLSRSTPLSTRLSDVSSKTARSR